MGISDDKFRSNRLIGDVKVIIPKLTRDLCPRELDLYEGARTDNTYKGVLRM